MQALQDFLADYRVFGLIFGVLIGVGLYIRRRIGDGKTAGGVVVVAFGLAACVVGGIVLHVIQSRRGKARFEHVIDTALRAGCTEPAPSTPIERDMRELQCSTGVRSARLTAKDVDIGVQAHGHLFGLVLPRVPAGATYVVWLLDAAGAPVNHIVVEPGSGFQSAHAAGTGQATQAVLTTEAAVGAAPAGPVVAKATL